MGLSLETKELGLEAHVKYFAPYHGHSEADGHFGLGKINLKRSAKNGPVLSVEQIFKAFAKLKNTIVQEIEVVQNSELVAPLENQIRKWFEFKMMDGQCYCREFGGRGEWIENTILTQEEKKEKKREKKAEKKEEKEKRKLEPNVRKEKRKRPKIL